MGLRSIDQTYQDELNREARTMFHAVLGVPPEKVLKERYVDAVFKAFGRDAKALPLPALCHRFPLLVQLFEPFGGKASPSQMMLKNRMLIALYLAETHPSCFSAFVIETPQSFVPSVAEILGIFALQSLLLPGRLATRLFWSHV